MKTSIEKKGIEIADLLQEFNSRFEKMLIDLGSEFKGNVIKGYKAIEYKTRIDEIESLVQNTDELIRSYSEFLYAGKTTIDVAKEALSFYKLTASGIQNHLKTKYIEKYEDLNSIPIKKEKLVELYSFSNEQNELIDEIVDLCQSIQLNTGMHTDLDRYAKYLNKETGKYELTDEDRKQLLDKFTLKLSDEDLSHIISLHVLCIGLNSTKTPNYSFNQLPEINLSAMKFLQIDKNGYSSGTGVSLNIEKLIDPSGSKNIKHKLNGPVIKIKAALKK